VCKYIHINIYTYAYIYLCAGVRIHQAIGKQAAIRLRLPQPIGLRASVAGSEERMKGSGKEGLVTEADVEAAVINAEKKWEKALEVRRQADELSSQVLCHD
jgi:hypothetical protein